MLSPSPLARRPRPVPTGRGTVRGWWRRHRLAHLLRNAAVGAALVLWAGWALADPQNEAGSAAEIEAARQPFVAEWGGPLNTLAAAPAAWWDPAADAVRRPDEWRQGERSLARRHSGASLLVSRTRLETETRRNDPPSADLAVPALAAPQRASVDMDNIAYRWWFARRGHSVALGVGAATYRVRGADDGALHDFGNATLGSPLISVGVRHRVSESALLYLDAASARRWSADDAGGDYYGARAGVEWQTSRNGTFALEQGRVRLRLYSGTHAQMSLRVKRGGPMLVYRLSF